MNINSKMVFRQKVQEQLFYKKRSRHALQIYLRIARLMGLKRTEEKQAFPCLRVRGAGKECLMFQIYIEKPDSVGCQQS